MSKKSISSLNLTAFRKHFGMIIQKMNLTPTVRETTYSLYLGAAIPLPDRYATARIEILLGLSDDRSGLVVVEFNIVTADPFIVLWGSELLAHYGKRVANLNEDLSKPGDELWIMTRAADLQALLVAYDNLAKEWGKPALFGH